MPHPFVSKLLSSNRQRLPESQTARHALERFHQSPFPSHRFAEFKQAVRQFAPNTQVLSPDASKGEHGERDGGVIFGHSLIVVADTHPIMTAILRQVHDLQTVCHPRPNRGSPIVYRRDADGNISLRIYRPENLDHADPDGFAATVARCLGDLGMQNAINSASTLVRETVNNISKQYQRHYYRSTPKNSLVPSSIQEFVTLSGHALLGTPRTTAHMTPDRAERFAMLESCLEWIAYDLGILAAPPPTPVLVH